MIQEVEMMLQVQYYNYKYDFVNTQTLDRILRKKEIRQFYRPSEGKWIDVKRDPIRGMGGNYSGPDRRESYDMTPKR